MVGFGTASSAASVSPVAVASVAAGAAAAAAAVAAGPATAFKACFLGCRLRTLGLTGAPSITEDGMGNVPNVQAGLMGLITGGAQVPPSRG